MMGFQITPHTGIRIIADNPTRDELVEIRDTNDMCWYLRAKNQTHLRLDEQLHPGVRSIDLSLEKLSAAVFPPLHDWFAHMEVRAESGWKLVYQHGQWPTACSLQDIHRSQIGRGGGDSLGN